MDFVLETLAIPHCFLDMADFRWLVTWVTGSLKHGEKLEDTAFFILNFVGIQKLHHGIHKFFGAGSWKLGSWWLEFVLPFVFGGVVFYTWNIITRCLLNSLLRSVFPGVILKWYVYSSRWRCFKNEGRTHGWSQVSVNHRSFEHWKPIEPRKNQPYFPLNPVCCLFNMIPYNNGWWNHPPKTG